MKLNLLFYAIFLCFITTQSFSQVYEVLSEVESNDKVEDALVSSQTRIYSQHTFSGNLNRVSPTYTINYETISFNLSNYTTTNSTGVITYSIVCTNTLGSTLTDTNVPLKRFLLKQFKN